MRHTFRPSMSGGECLICGYDDISHTATAVCEACGLSGECDLFPNDRDPRKMLLCAECYTRDAKLTQVAKPVQTLSSVAITPYQVRTAGDYFNASIPAIVDIHKAIEADDTIPADQKRYEEAKQVKTRLAYLSKSLFDLDKERAVVANEQRDTLVYFNHLQKELSAEKQHELGIKDIAYKPQEKVKKTRQPSAPSVKKFDKTELTKIAAQYGIEVHTLQTIVTARKVSVEEAAKIAKAIQDKHAAS